jgi:hypothetical protein
MDALTADGFVNDVLYAIDKVRDLHDPEAQDGYVQHMIDRRYFTGRVDEYAEAIAQTVRAGRLPEHSRDLSRRFSEAEQLAFLGALHERLEQRKPWPRPAFVKIPVTRWDELGNVVAVARIDRPMHALRGIFNTGFDRVAVGDDTLPVLLLELRTGEVAAVIGSVDPRSTVFTLMRRDGDDPAPVLAHFLEVTGIDPQDVTAL